MNKLQRRLDLDNINLFMFIDNYKPTPMVMITIINFVEILPKLLSLDSIFMLLSLVSYRMQMSTPILLINSWTCMFLSFLLIPITFYEMIHKLSASSSSQITIGTRVYVKEFLQRRKSI